MLLKCLHASINDCFATLCYEVPHGFAEYNMNVVTSELAEEILFIFPVLALVSSPSRCIKQIAGDILSILGKTATALLIAPKKKPAGQCKQQSITTPGHLMFKFLRNLWFEVLLNQLGKNLLSFFFFF